MRSCGPVSTLPAPPLPQQAKRLQSHVHPVLSSVLCRRMCPADQSVVVLGGLHLCKNQEKGKESLPVELLWMYQSERRTSCGCGCLLCMDSRGLVGPNTQRLIDRVKTVVCFRYDKPLLIHTAVIHSVQSRSVGVIGIEKLLSEVGFEPSPPGRPQRSSYVVYPPELLPSQTGPALEGQVGRRVATSAKP